MTNKIKQKQLSQIDINNLSNSTFEELLIYYIITDDIVKFVSIYYQMNALKVLPYRQILLEIFPDTKEYIKYFSVIFKNDFFYTFDNITKKNIIYLFWYVRFIKIDKDYIEFYNILKEIFYKEAKNNNLEIMFFLYIPLVFSYLGVDLSMDAAKKFNEEINLKLQEVILKNFKNIQPKIKKKKNKKIKVGFLIERNIMHSMNKVVYSLFKILDKKKYQKKYKFYIFNLEYFELGGGSSDIEREFKNFKYIKYYNLHEKFNYKKSPFYNQVEKAIKVRKFIIDKKIDVLINSGFIHPTFSFLFITRTASKQFYWSHGNCEYDIKGIDKRISHFVQTCKDKKFEVFNVPTDKKLLIGSKEQKKAAKQIKKEFLKTFGKDTVILGTIGRLVKLESKEYIKTISIIMKQNPNTIYLACGSGDKKNIKKLLKKYKIDEKRFLFLGHVDAHIYGWVIDVWPDSFPLRQGQSKNEYIAKGGVVVFMEKYLNDTIRNWYKNFEMKLWGNNEKEYIQKVNKFIKNKELRSKLSKFNKKIFKQKRIDLSKLL